MLVESATVGVQPGAASAKQQKCRRNKIKGRGESSGSLGQNDKQTTSCEQNPNLTRQRAAHHDRSTSLIRISILLLSVAHRYTQSFSFSLCSVSLLCSLFSSSIPKRKPSHCAEFYWCSTVHFHAQFVKELVVCVQDTHTVPRNIVHKTLIESHCVTS